jgi:hypothetical protein
VDRYAACCHISYLILIASSPRLREASATRGEGQQSRGASCTIIAPEVRAGSQLKAGIKAAYFITVSHIQLST